MRDDERIRVKIVAKLYRKNVVGAHKVTVETAKNWLATDEQGRAESVIREMVRDPTIPLEAYGGSRDNRLTDKTVAREFSELHGVETKWWD